MYFEKLKDIFANIVPKIIIKNMIHQPKEQISEYFTVNIADENMKKNEHAF